MNDGARTNIGTPAAPPPASPGSAELRGQVERTRDELGQTVEALTGKADSKARAKQKTTDVKGQAAQKVTLASDQIREKAGHAAQLVKDRTPDPLLEKAGQAATAARANRTPLLVVGAVGVLLLVRRSRGRRR
ncbi:DUF3618 domain-containing protein [Streptomyces sp. NPDC058682]|uniref:DUF3618 domain-containing protein n=1 Tax=Streptomyces sp. NPDC058682 TaxID=3346596 RepID=UPI00365D3987